MSDIQIVWGDDEKDQDEDTAYALKGDPDDIPEYALGNPGIVVKGNHDFKFEEPIWGHADTFMELEEAGAMNLQSDEPTIRFGEYTVYVYTIA